jgi:type I restriction enzyme, S subunit
VRPESRSIVAATGARPIPRGWATAALPDIVSPEGVLTDGDWVETEDQDPEGEIRLIQLADVGDGFFKDRSHRFLTELKSYELRCTILEPGDLLIARMPDPLGRACVFPGLGQRCCTVVDVCIVRPGTDAIDARWLMHFVNAPRFRLQISEMQSGSTRKRISKKNLSSIPLRVPPAAEQGRIADALDSCLTRLDAAAEGLRRVEANLKRYQASVLKAAVEGRLVPTEAELAKREGRAYEPASELLARILKERRRRWEAAELAKLKAKGESPKTDTWKSKYQEPTSPDPTNLPPLPEGWCWTSLGQAFNVTVGATPSRSVANYWGGKIPWVSSGEVAFCRIKGTAESITEEGLENSSTKMNPPGSVLLGMIGEGKTRGQVAILDIPACGNQNAAAIWVSETEVLPEFVYHYLAGEYEITRRRGSGNNQPALNKSRVEAIPLPLAPADEQERIVAYLEDVMSELAKVESSADENLKRIARLRQSILTWAFEGKLVDQDPNDEPASVLLASIRAQRDAEKAAPGPEKAGRRTSAKRRR